VRWWRLTLFCIVFGRSRQQELAAILQQCLPPECVAEPAERLRIDLPLDTALVQGCACCGTTASIAARTCSAIDMASAAVAWSGQKLGS